MEAKKDIRKRVLDIRNSLSKRDWEEKSHIIIEKVTSHPIFLEAEEIYCYINFRSEVNTRNIIEQSWKMNKKVAVPKIENQEMKFLFANNVHYISFLAIDEPFPNIHY